MTFQRHKRNVLCKAPSLVPLETIYIGCWLGFGEFVYCFWLTGRTNGHLLKLIGRVRYFFLYPAGFEPATSRSECTPIADLTERARCLNMYNILCFFSIAVVSLLALNSALDKCAFLSRICQSVRARALMLSRGSARFLISSKECLFVGTGTRKPK